MNTSELFAHSRSASFSQYHTLNDGEEMWALSTRLNGHEKALKSAHTKQWQWYDDDDIESERAKPPKINELSRWCYLPHWFTYSEHAKRAECSQRFLINRQLSDVVEKKRFFVWVVGCRHWWDFAIRNLAYDPIYWSLLTQHSTCSHFTCSSAALSHSSWALWKNVICAENIQLAYAA